MIWSLIFFILVGAVSLATAVGVVTSRQPVHGALFLLAHFVTLSVLYITLDAQFLAAVQVIVYAGGIVILILFVIMLIGSREVHDAQRGGMWASLTGVGLGVVLLISMIISFAGAYGGAAPDAAPLEGGAPYAVGMSLFTRYILPIEMVAVLLLVALIGALLLARHPSDKGEEGAQRIAEGF